MANQLYGQQSVSGVYTSSRSAIDTYFSEPSLLTSSRYLPTFSDHHSLPSDHHSLPSDPTSSSLYRTAPTLDAGFLHYSPSSASIDIPGLGAGMMAANSITASRGIAPTTTSNTLWPAFSICSTVTKRSSEALYDNSVVGAHMIGRSEAWLTSDSLAKRPRLESASSLPIYPQRPGEKDCAHYMVTRTCKFGDSCKFDHPVWVPMGGIPDWKEPPSVPSEFHPERPGEPDCPYFLKTQKCKFGLKCKFNHPKDKLDTSGKTDASNLPQRLSEPLCSFYMATGKCKFGAACKFHHPKDVQIPSDAGNGAETNSVEHVGTIGGGNAVKKLTPNLASSYNSKGLPIRLGEVDCPFYMKTGSCKYGANCRYNHPDRSVISPPAVVGHSVVTSPLANLNVGLVNPVASIFQSLQPSLAQTTFGLGPVIYPQRPGQTECDYYMKTGDCKFGERCKFHHPIDRSAPTRKQTHEQNVKLTLVGLPRREGVSHCPFYMKTGTCSYGATCKFDHPPPGEVMALAGKETTAEGGEKNGENVATI